MRPLRIAMAQINTTVGDFTGNRRKIIEAINEVDMNTDKSLYFKARCLL